MGHKNNDSVIKLIKDYNTSVAFTAAVGNPPYQKNTSGSSTLSVAVYHNIMTNAQLCSQYISLVYPSRWMLGGTGTGLNEFREIEGASKHYKSFYDYSNSESIFSNVIINAGVNYFLWDKDKITGDVKYYYNNKLQVRSSIDENGFVRDNDYANIVKKINADKSISSIVESKLYYGSSVTNFVKVEKLYKSGTGLYCYAVDKGKGVKRIEIDFNNDRDRLLNDYKVVVSNTAHYSKNSSLSRTDRIFIAEPNTIISDSFLKVGSFNNAEEANSCLLYLKTDFCNFLLGVVTPTQHVTKNSYRLIPMIDFVTGEIMDKPGVFLDFSNPESLDDQLYSIYSITIKEQDTIAKDLKKWKDKTSVTADM